MYKVGMKVKINPFGHNEYGVDRRNPQNDIGEVIDETNEGWCQVRWSNGFTNEYENNTLDIVE